MGRKTTVELIKSEKKGLHFGWDIRTFTRAKNAGV
jgi:hypothetical protein